MHIIFSTPIIIMNISKPNTKRCFNNYYRVYNHSMTLGTNVVLLYMYLLFSLYIILYNKKSNNSNVLAKRDVDRST